MPTFLEELDNCLIDDILNMLYGYYLDIGKTIKINNIKYTVLDTINIKVGSEFKNDKIMICLLYGNILIVGVDSPYIFKIKDDDGNFNSIVILPKKIVFEQ
uniref:Uncharacterized protein n=1 Tax=viral metagenome TaxID=1070528 RepID=A0A6C0BDI1_9ZZZZ